MGVTPVLGDVGVGGLLLGAIPVAISVAARLVARSMVVGVAFAASAYGTCPCTSPRR